MKGSGGVRMLTAADFAKNKPLRINDTYKFNFYGDLYCTITYISIADPIVLDYYLKKISKNQYILYLDLEWTPDRRKSSNNPIAMYQIGNSRGEALLIYNEGFAGNRTLGNFLSKNTFYSKDPSCDLMKLRTLHKGHTFQNIVDITALWIVPLKLPRSFAALFEELVGKANYPIKDKSISGSDWGALPHVTKQILYAAFDVYALCLEHVCVRGRLDHMLSDVWAFFFYKHNTKLRYKSRFKRIFIFDSLRIFWSFYPSKLSLDSLTSKEGFYLIRQGYSYNKFENVYKNQWIDVSIFFHKTDNPQEVFLKIVLLMIGEQLDDRIKCMYAYVIKKSLCVHFWAIDVSGKFGFNLAADIVSKIGEGVHNCTFSTTRARKKG